MSRRVAAGGQPASADQDRRIPCELETEGTEVPMHEEGDRPILTPVRRNRPSEPPASRAPLEEGLPERGHAPPQTPDGP